MHAYNKTRQTGEKIAESLYCTGYIQVANLTTQFVSQSFRRSSHQPQPFLTENKKYML